MLMILIGNSHDKGSIEMRTVTARLDIEVFVDCPLEICEQRDVKGLYKKARAGEISNFTGISSPFERPANADVHVKSDILTVEESLEKVMKEIKVKLEV